MMPHAVTLCICTFRRPHIADTLRSVAQLQLPPECSLKIIVADNDDSPSARSLVEDTARAAGLTLTYLHAPARNISVARNACLDVITTPLAAFIDDDELMTPGWLTAMLQEMEASSADAVLGPVQAVYDSPCPAWMREADMHSTRPVWVQGKIITGYSCNVLFRPDAPALRGRRFRLELGRSGGEDTEFFSAMVRVGGSIAFAPEALVTEQITPERAKLGWLMKRRFRSGQTHGLLLLEQDGSGAGAIARNGGAALVKAIFCFAATLPVAFQPPRRYFWLLRGIMHLGVVSRLLGKRELVQYG